MLGAAAVSGGIFHLSAQPQLGQLHCRGPRDSPSAQRWEPGAGGLCGASLEMVHIFRSCLVAVSAGPGCPSCRVGTARAEAAQHRRRDCCTSAGEPSQALGAASAPCRASSSCLESPSELCLPASQGQEMHFTALVSSSLLDFTKFDVKTLK